MCSKQRSNVKHTQSRRAFKSSGLKSSMSKRGAHTEEPRDVVRIRGERNTMIELCILKRSSCLLRCRAERAVQKFGVAARRGSAQVVYALIGSRGRSTTCHASGSK